MEFRNRRWLVIPTAIQHQINFSEIREANIESLRLSKDGSKTFIKYDVKVVQKTYTETHIDEITGDEISYTTEDFDEYDHEGILELLSTEEWHTNELEE